MKKKLWLIGTGYMSREYSKVLKHLNIPFSVIGNSKKSSEEFSNEQNIDVVKGGAKFAMKSMETPSEAIVAVNIERTFEITYQLISRGAKKILVEKPGSLYFKDLKELTNHASKNNCQVFVAYNRRFYSSVDKLKKLASKEGGIKSIQFEFTEWSHILRNEVIPSNEKKYWIIANSSHVIDLAFFLAGIPETNKWSAQTSGFLDWHPSGSCFFGSGFTKNNIPFTYNSNWSSAGRWSIELMTTKNRYLLKPLEKLQRIKLGELEPKFLEIDDEKDKNFKPGIFKQTYSFLNNKYDDLCTIHEQLENIKIYNKIGGY